MAVSTNFSHVCDQTDDFDWTEFLNTNRVYEKSFWTESLKRVSEQGFWTELLNRSQSFWTDFLNKSQSFWREFLNRGQGFWTEVRVFEQSFLTEVRVFEQRSEFPNREMSYTELPSWATIRTQSTQVPKM